MATLAKASFYCKPRKIGRYLNIRLVGNSMALTLCEVEVYSESRGVFLLNFRDFFYHAFSILPHGMDLKTFCLVLRVGLFLRHPPEIDQKRRQSSLNSAVVKNWFNRSKPGRIIVNFELNQIYKLFVVCHPLPSRFCSGLFFKLYRKIGSETREKQKKQHRLQWLLTSTFRICKKLLLFSRMLKTFLVLVQTRIRRGLDQTQYLTSFQY